MDDDYSSDDGNKPKPSPIKIIPRNLTAFAAYPVPGNPAISRPESGVEVSFPGLEIDQRALEQRFFPGLYFEFQREDGAILADIELQPNQLPSGLSRSDLSPLRPLFLLGIYYKVKATDKEPQFISFQRLRGQDVGPVLRDLLPGRVAIIFGPSWEVVFADAFNLRPFRIDGRINQLASAYDAFDDAEKFKVYRDNDGQLICGIFSDDRTDYLDEFGVIDTAIFPPGDLTKSLCAPWIYDFRDCLCFYWASNKPDITEGTEPPFINYLRDREIKPPAPTSADYHKWVNRRIAAGFLMSGEWRKLPVVINDREEIIHPVKVFGPKPGPHVPPPDPFQDLNPDFNRDNIINELKYLATVEHALIVEYLFAHYSLNAPPSLKDKKVDDETKIIFGVAVDLLEIATDEMRHFLWVNQLLHLLGCKDPITDRAEVIGLPPEKDNRFNRKRLRGFEYLEKPVLLRTVSLGVLNEFIEIETNSRKVGPSGTAFGMYVQLLASLLEGDAKLANSAPVVRIVKLLIDEGDQHGLAFQSMKQRFESVKPPRVRELSLNGKYDPKILSLVKLGDQHYQDMLKLIHVSFGPTERAGESLRSDMIKLMRQLHEVGHVLAGYNVGLPFTMPKRDKLAVPKSKKDALDVLYQTEEALMLQLTEVEDTGDDQGKHLAQRQRKTSKKLYRKMRRTIEEDR